MHLSASMLIGQRRFSQQQTLAKFFLFFPFIFSLFSESMDVEEQKVLASEHPWYRGVALSTMSIGAQQQRVVSTIIFITFGSYYISSFILLSFVLVKLLVTGKSFFTLVKTKAQPSIYYHQFLYKQNVFDGCEAVGACKRTY